MVLAAEARLSTSTLSWCKYDESASKINKCRWTRSFDSWFWLYRQGQCRNKPGGGLSACCRRFICVKPRKTNIQRMLYKDSLPNFKGTKSFLVVDYQIRFRWVSHKKFKSNAAQPASTGRTKHISVEWIICELSRSQVVWTPDPSSHARKGLGNN